MRILKKIFEFFSIKCSKCKSGHLSYIGDDITDLGVWFGVYECKRCKEKFV